MRRMIAVVILVLLSSGYVYAADSASVPASQQPMVKEKTGTGKIFLEAAIYPEFTDIVPSAADPWCTAANPKVFDYLTGKDIRTKSNSPNLKAGWGNHSDPRIRLLLGVNPKRVVTTEPWPNGRILDETRLGDQETDLFIALGAGAISRDYRETAKILTTWTMRIEGECPNWHIGHFICEPYNGTLTFVCPPGKVITWLVAEYETIDKKGIVIKKKQRLGHDVIMEMPRTIQKSKQVDPTLTGTYVITKYDFPEKKIPEKLTLRVYWKNETSLYIWSPGGMRNMIVNVMPYTKAGK